MTKLHDLYELGGQSPWVDNLTRGWLTGGHLAELVAHGVRGVTSNPTIFAKAIEDSSDYDEQMAALLPTMGVDAAYWELVIDDIRDALALLRPTYEASGSGDGFVSLEVSPALAHDQEATLHAAHDLHDRIDRPNLLVKIPATKEGVGAIGAAISDGHSINVTLIFSLERYEAVIEAYLSGLEARAATPGVRDLSDVASVASFFVSRVDTEVDRRLETLAAQGAITAGELARLRGKAAIAQAQLAYRIFEDRFSGPRWDALAAKGARVQRPLWASTSTKNPAYPDLAYVDALIGPHTVNTMPEATLDAFLDHGTVARTVDARNEQAEADLAAIEAAGVDMASVSETLEDEGVASFAKSFDELIERMEQKANTLGTGT